VRPLPFAFNPLTYLLSSSDSAIHDARPDVVAAAHCHSLYGKTWSVFGRPIDILQQDGCLFHDNLSVYANYGGVVLAAEEGNNIATALGPTNKACILQNHGLLTRMWNSARVLSSRVFTLLFHFHYFLSD
jgi:ribulose-5-phosphate 4-epimerase/fuculose-1-phosphate aldolase